MNLFFIGIDVSKETIDVSFFEPQHMKKPEYLATYDNRPKGFRSMVKDLQKCSYGIGNGQWLFCCETTGRYDYDLCNWICDNGMFIWRESALQIKWCSGIQRGKNDEVDSLRITEYAWRHRDKAIRFVKPNEALASLKALFSHRKQLVIKRTAANCQYKALKVSKQLSGEAYKLIRSNLANEITCLTKSIKAADKAMLAIIATNEELQRNYQHIISIKGVGPVTALAIIVFSGNFQVIPTAAKFACYCGVASFRNQSGTSINTRAKVSNLSNRLLKSILSMAAYSAAKNNPLFSNYFNRTIERGKSTAIAYNNIKNKIIIIAYKLVQDDVDFDLEYEHKHSAKKSKAS